MKKEYQTPDVEFVSLEPAENVTVELGDDSNIFGGEEDE